MAKLLVADVDDGLVRLMEQRADRHGRTAEAEHRAILETTLRGACSTFAAKAEHLVAELQGRTFTDSADSIRADRDRNGAAG